ncbi:very short patch repair endonuclease [Phocaeicola plebeius]|uniref:very short patch repair endonuclease n=1 Tax=Phocaeicola plebeius TaxID=310297 RepID=UPI0026F00DEE|nr:very short patch repair endonuclease [Phocaeicola plebeius]
MSDVMTPEQRSRCMAAIRGKDTKPEILVRKFLFSKGLRYRLNNRKLPGSPDIVLKKYKTVIFVDGCFWHGHEGCKYFRLPKSNTPFWEAKITRNIERDKETTQALTALGWKVIRIWECELRNKSNREAALNKLFNDIKCSAVKRYSIEESDILVAAESESPYSEG